MTRDEMTPEQLAAAMAAYKKRNDEEEVRLRSRYSNPVPLETIKKPLPAFTGMLSRNAPEYQAPSRMNVSDLTASPNMTTPWEEDYVDMLGELEGTYQHEDNAGIATAPYGITAAASMVKKADETDREFATRAVYKYRDKAKDKVGETWDELLPTEQQLATDVMFNAGGNAPKFFEQLKKGNTFEAMKETLDIVTSSDASDGNKKKVYLGLAKRRALMFNKVAEEAGLPLITDVTAQYANGYTYLKYLRGNKEPITLKIKKPKAAGVSTIAMTQDPRVPYRG